MSERAGPGEASEPDRAGPTMSEWRSRFVGSPELSSESLLIVIGSRCMADSEAAKAWAKSELWRWLRCRRSTAVSATFLSGGADGPDSWGEAGAVHLGVPAVGYLLDGSRSLVGAPASGPDRWTDDEPPAAGSWSWKKWCLRRNDAVVMSAACSAARARRAAEALAVVAPWSHTQGTEYTARRLARAGVLTSVVFAPASMAPAPAEPEQPRKAQR